MKNAKKVIVLALCAILLVAASVMGTLAYLTSQATVQNTFTVGNVSIKLEEYVVDPQTGVKNANATPVTAMENLELVPGREIQKNPFITVNGTESCWLVVKVTNELGEAITINGMDDWNKVEVAGKDGYYMYKQTVDAGEKINVFTSITCKDTNTSDSLAALAGKKIVVTAYAIQAENVDKANVISYLSEHYTLN